MIEQKEVIKMDMYQKRKIRAEKKNNDSQKSFSKVLISWYPGHMAKTKRLISEQINLFNDDGKEVDSIYEDLPVNIQEEFIQRDQETLKALQMDEDLRAYVEKKTGRKVEEIFNYKALTDFSVILKKANIETDEQ